MRTWVIGAGGLFGQALVRASGKVFKAPPIPWKDETAAVEILSQALVDFTKLARGDDWSIVWAAGQATTSSTPEQTSTELRLFSSFIELLKTNTPAGKGVFAVTSSAGGVYAGSSNPPFSSSTPPVPVSAYGRLKLDQEQVAQTLSPQVPVVSLRLSNLYGPGQNLTKLQGIISHLALAAITRNPIKIFVPLDTLRDYIYVGDAATHAMHWIKEAAQKQVSGTKGVASGQPQTLGRIVTLMNDISRVRIPVASGFDESAAFQAHDLRMLPDSDLTTERMALTQLPCGMKRTLANISDLHAHASIVA
jgi:UDP-glucose 4-epimerase